MSIQELHFLEQCLWMFSFAMPRNTVILHTDRYTIIYLFIIVFVQLALALSLFVVLQGVHELLAPIIFVVDSDKRDSSDSLDSQSEM